MRSARAAASFASDLISRSSRKIRNGETTSIVRRIFAAAPVTRESVRYTLGHCQVGCAATCQGAA